MSLVFFSCTTDWHSHSLGDGGDYFAFSSKAVNGPHYTELKSHRRLVSPHAHYTVSEPGEEVKAPVALAFRSTNVNMVNVIHP